MIQGSADWLQGKRVAITGRFGSHSQHEFRELLYGWNAEVDVRPIRYTRFLIVGEATLPLVANAKPTRALLAARRLNLIGYPIEVLSEQEFWARLGNSDTAGVIHRHYTISQIAELLYIPRDQLRAWVGRGLIEAQDTVNGCAVFDLAYVQWIQLVCELRQAGLSIDLIVRQLERLRLWFPALGAALDRGISRVAGKEILIRDGEGQLLQLDGQLWFDFETDTDPVVEYVSRKSADDLFAEGLDFEDAGDYRQAARSYNSALHLDPNDPVVHFNLGNVYVAIGDRKRAIDHFRRALRIAPDFTDARNNLRLVLINDVATSDVDPSAAYQHP